MRFSFRDFSHYYASPPDAASLLSKVRDDRKGKAQLLIMVASYRDNIRLGRFFDEMKLQTPRNFDILVIYGQDDEFLRDEQLSVFHANRKFDFGFAGSAYAGQLFALMEGYDYYLFTDVDKFPSQSDTIERMLGTAKNQNADCVSGKTSWKGIYLTKERKFQDYKELKISRLPWVGVWNVIKTSSLAKTGMFLLPVYLGTEELEFGYRMELRNLRHVRMDFPVFYTYSSVKDNFFGLLLKGGKDSTCIYSNLLCDFNYPNIWIQAGYPLNILQQFYHFFSARIFLFRESAFGSYFEKARQGIFGLFDWETEGSTFSLKEEVCAGPGFIMVSSADYPHSIRRAFTTYDNLKLLARLLFATPPAPLLHSSTLDFFTLSVFDRFHVYDEQSGRTYLFSWGSKIRLPDKLSALLLASWDMAIFVGKGIFLHLAGAHRKYCSYGQELISKYQTSRNR